KSGDELVHILDGGTTLTIMTDDGPQSFEMTAGMMIVVPQGRGRVRQAMITNIRRARPEEAEQLTELAHAAKRHWKYPEPWIRLWRDDLTVSPRFIRAHPVFCAVRGAELVGFYALSRSGAEFELEHLWVHPRHMGGGVGSELFRHAVSRIRRQQGTALRIASDPN